MFSTHNNNGDNKAKQLGEAFLNLIKYRQLRFKVMPSRLSDDSASGKSNGKELTDESLLKQVVQKSSRLWDIKLLGLLGFLFHLDYHSLFTNRLESFHRSIRCGRHYYDYGTEHDTQTTLEIPLMRVTVVGDLTAEEGLKMAEGNLKRLKGQLDYLEIIGSRLPVLKEKQREFWTGKVTPPSTEITPYIVLKRVQIVACEGIVKDLKRLILTAERH